MNTKPHSLLLMVLFFFILFCQFLIAGTTGKLAGRVTDAESGEPLPGVNILLEGTYLGASTDLEGEYFIINIPPGTYTVKAVYVGYSEEIIQKIQINADRTTKIDFLLSSALLKTDAIVIVAEKELIQKDLTGSMSTVSANDIAEMPVQSIDEVLNLQAGVIQGDGGIHVRGGRTGETLYMVDGVSITDLDGSQGIEVETDAVQELQLISGTFNAEYGKAMSGIINIITKEGSKNYSGQIQAQAASYLSGSNTYSVMKSFGPKTDPETGQTAMVAESNNPLTSIRPQYDVRGTFSGPVPFLGKNLNFFVSGRYRKDNGYIYGRNLYTPQGLPGDSSLVALRQNTNVSLQAKITFRPFSGLKIDYSTFFNSSDIDHNTGVIERYVPESGRQRINRSMSQIISVNHSLAPSTFYELKLSNYYSESESYLYSDPTLTPKYFIRVYKTDGLGGEEIPEDRFYTTEEEKQAILSNARENSWRFEFIIDPSSTTGYLDPTVSSTRVPSSFRDRYTPQNYNYNSDKFWLGKFDLTSQVSNNHLLKGGIEAIFHTINREAFTLRPKVGADGKDIVPFEPDVPSTSSIWNNKFTRSPIEISGYLQDKMEFDQLIVNIGLRIDYFDPDYIKPVDTADPDIYNPFRPEWKGPAWDEAYYIGLSNADKKAYEAANSYTPEQRRKLMQKRVKPKVQLSPRIGIAYPISEKGVIHFSYGHFFQMPEAQYLYGSGGNTRPDYKLNVGNQLQRFGNADLRAEQTVQYEIGLQSQIGQSIGLDVTLFYKDIRDWIGISPLFNTRHAQTTKYAQYENRDYANVRGITLAFEARPSNNLTATLDYTYQVAEGTYSDPGDAYNALANNQEPAKKLIFMDYDRRHSVNTIFTYRYNGWVSSIIGKYNSGFPYTPAPSLIQVAQDNKFRGWRENIARRPSNSQVDLRVDKVLFETGAFSHKLFIRVYNLFDQRGELNVYSDTGTAKFTTAVTSYIPNRIGSLEQYYLNPNWYQAPREIQLSYILNF